MIIITWHELKCNDDYFELDHDRDDVGDDNHDDDDDDDNDGDDDDDDDDDDNDDDEMQR